jgi:hypothetical protein
MSDAHRKIIENLDGRVYPVNLWVALSGLDAGTGRDALNDLIRDGRVKVEYMRSLPNAPALYRLTVYYPPKLKVVE